MSEQQGLTPRDYAILEAAFDASEIGAKDRQPYVKRSAIMRRLRLVDPGYFPDIIPHVEHVGDTVTVWGTLTLKGVKHTASSSVYINAWRKEDPKADKSAYVRVNDFEYARELASAQKKAATLLLFRCAETFGLGLYLKEKVSAPSLASVLDDTPKHWSAGPGGERIKALMTELKLDNAAIKETLEPGKTLTKWGDTTLTEEQVSVRLKEIADGIQKKAQPTNGDSLRQN